MFEQIISKLPENSKNNSFGDITYKLYNSKENEALNGVFVTENKNEKMVIPSLPSRVVSGETSEDLFDEYTRYFNFIEGPMIRVYMFDRKIIICDQTRYFINNYKCSNLKNLNETREIEQLTFNNILFKKYGKIFDNSKFSYSPFVYYFRYRDDSYNNFYHGEHEQELEFMGFLDVRNADPENYSTLVPKEYKKEDYENAEIEKEGWEFKPYKKLIFKNSNSEEEVSFIRSNPDYIESGGKIVYPVVIYKPDGIVRFYPQSYLQKIAIRNGKPLNEVKYNDRVNKDLVESKYNFILNSVEIVGKRYCSEVSLNNIFDSTLPCYLKD